MRSLAEVRFQSVNVHTKNAMDFVIAVYTGQLMMMPNTEKVIIISEDNGYKAVIDAGNQKKQNIMEQCHTLLDAWYSCARKETVYVSKGTKGINEAKKGILVRNRKYAAAKRYAVNPLKYESVINASGNDKKALYLGMMHTFGKERGLEINLS